MSSTRASDGTVLVSDGRHTRHYHVVGPLLAHVADGGVRGRGCVDDRAHDHAGFACVWTYALLPSPPQVRPQVHFVHLSFLPFSDSGSLLASA